MQDPRQRDMEVASGQGPWAVLYDGNCPVCRGAVDRLRAWDREGRLSFVSAQDPAVASRFPEVSPEDLRESLHVVDSQGRTWRGARAVEALVRILPGWRWAGWLFRLPLVRPLAEAVYRWVARNRYRLFCREHCTWPSSE